MRKSTIEHERSQMGCFITVQFGYKMVIGYFSCTRMYDNLHFMRDWDRRYSGEYYL